MVKESWEEEETDDVADAWDQEEEVAPPKGLTKITKKIDCFKASTISFCLFV